ncbi:hypothetical protein H4R18_002311 [Coemansia javaensis]|uniref:Survival Motor Neuron Gemin2-binding domain-containing protein n=1 Tax=Coemansia javaensis TaxID=2761396 RepID=A0A9W8HFG3_9FUNG|nr:hypothetical protein H4R18_002311 [Coemansia javaensis]
MAAARQLVSYDDLFDAEDAVGGDAGGSGSPEAAGDWDDTALIQAWDSTIESYRKQHARMMGDDEFMARQHEQESRVGEWAPVAAPEPSRKRRRSADARADSSGRDSADGPGSGDGAGGPGSEDWWAAQFAAPQTEQEALHGLSMAWYYVGYYTACYQGFRSGAEGA